MDNGLQMPNETIIILMNPDLSYGAPVWQEQSGQWIAELAFFDALEQDGGSCILTFTEQDGTWKIAKIRLGYSQ